MSDAVQAPPSSATDWAWAALAAEWLQPVNLVLALTILAMSILLIRLQRRSDFDFSRMLKDDNLKESFPRLAGIGAFACSTWVLMSEAIGAKADVLVPLFEAYLVVWSGSAVIGKGIEAWAAVKMKGSQ